MSSDPPFSQDAAEEERLESMVGPPGVWRESRWFQIEFLRAHGLRPGDCVLDIGCGPLRGGLPLIDYLDPGGYTGIDVRSEVIEEAHRQVNAARVEDKKPTIAVSRDFGRDVVRRRFDVVWCFQVLYHLEDDQVGDLMSRLPELLQPGGVMYGNADLGPRNPGKRWKEFPFKRRPMRFYRRVAEDHGVAIGDLGPLGDHGYTTAVRGHRSHMLTFSSMA